jgi:hypothetical protein
MPPKFASLEARLNTAVFGHISNTTATVSGVAVDGIFDNGYALGGAGPLGMASSQPMLTLATAAVPANPVGTTVVVNSTSYTIAEVDSDGTGISRLMLEAV